MIEVELAALNTSPHDSNQNTGNTSSSTNRRVGSPWNRLMPALRRQNDAVLTPKSAADTLVGAAGSVVGAATQVVGGALNVVGSVVQGAGSVLNEAGGTLTTSVSEVEHKLAPLPQPPQLNPNARVFVPIQKQDDTF